MDADGNPGRARRRRIQIHNNLNEGQLQAPNEGDVGDDEGEDEQPAPIEGDVEEDADEEGSVGSQGPHEPGTEPVYDEEFIAHYENIRFISVNVSRIPANTLAARNLRNTNTGEPNHAGVYQKWTHLFALDFLAQHENHLYRRASRYEFITDHRILDAVGTNPVGIDFVTDPNVRERYHLGPVNQGEVGKWMLRVSYPLYIGGMLWVEPSEGRRSLTDGSARFSQMKSEIVRNFHSSSDPDSRRTVQYTPRTHWRRGEYDANNPTATVALSNEVVTYFYHPRLFPGSDMRRFQRQR